MANISEGIHGIFLIFEYVLDHTQKTPQAKIQPTCIFSNPNMAFRTSERFFLTFPFFRPSFFSYYIA